jgi:ribosomal protein S12 methylthiotransferase
LLERVLEATEIPWIRLLYIYSAGLQPSLVRLMAKEDRVLSYIDMPIQHASASMLERMRRPERPERLRDKISWLRSEIPDLALRTTVMVGFPGETEEEFEQLLEFMGEVKFDHLGAFAYSPQEGTPGAEMPDPVPDPIRMERLEAVNELQRSIVAAHNEVRLGTEVEVIVDRVAGETDHFEARMCSQAFEIDGMTYLDGSSVPLEPGDLALARVTNSDDADVWAAAERRVRAARPPVEHVEPVSLDLQTAWGR